MILGTPINLNRRPMLMASAAAKLSLLKATVLKGHDVFYKRRENDEGTLECHQ